MYGSKEGGHVIPFVSREMVNLPGKTKGAPPLSLAVWRLRTMKSLKEVSLIAAVVIALMAITIAASPSMEVGCQGRSSVVHTNDVDALAPTGNMSSSPDFGVSGFGSGLDQQSIPCDSGDTVHSHGCHSHSLASASASAIAQCSPTLISTVNDYFHPGSTVQPPTKPPRISA